MIAALATIALAQPPAYPGAEGFGAHAWGGRLGDVCIVTNCDDGGVGSFRDCVETGAPGPRITLAEVSCSAPAATPIDLAYPMTVALGTGPGPFVITGSGLIVSSPDVVIIDAAVINGDALWDPANQATGDPLLIRKQARPVAITHSSFDWYRDDAQVWGQPAGFWPSDVTIQDSILGEPTGGKGFLIVAGADGAHTRVSLIGNLFAGSLSRHPQISNKGSGDVRVDFSRNVIYDMGGGKSQVGLNAFPTAPIAVRVRGNVYRRGPSVGYMSGSPAKVHLLATYPWPFGFAPIVATLEHDDNTLDGWAVNPTESDANFAGTWTMGSAGIPYELPPATSAEVLARGLAAGPRRRHALDQRLVEEVVLRTGSVKAAQPEPLPDVPELHRPEGWDTDRDGMPDAWEIAQGYDPSADDHNLDLDGDGWTAIEDYVTAAAAEISP